MDDRGLQDDLKESSRYGLTKSAQVLTGLIGFLLTAFPLGGIMIYKLYQFSSRNEVMKEVLASSNKLVFSALIGGAVGIFLGGAGAIVLIWIVSSIRDWKEDRARDKVLEGGENK